MCDWYAVFGVLVLEYYLVVEVGKWERSTARGCNAGLLYRLAGGTDKGCHHH
jgi:hypothetical protein